MNRALAIVCCAAALPTASAADLQLRDLGRPRAGISVTSAPVTGSPATLLQVLREVYPDLRPDGRAERFKGARVLPDAVDPDAGKPGPRDVDLAKAPGEPVYDVVEDGARRYLAIGVEGMVLLARVAPGYRFLDALFVQTDPGGPPALTRTFVLAPESPGMIVVNSHHNSQEGYASHVVVSLVKGRLAPVYDGPMLYSYSHASGGCDPLTVTQQLASLDVLAKGGAFADIAMQVRETRECVRVGRSAKPVEKLYPMRLIWDAKRMKYMGGSKELYLLNKKRMGG